jgi:hypothetical protein
MIAGKSGAYPSEGKNTPTYYENPNIMCVKRFIVLASGLAQK